MTTSKPIRVAALFALVLTMAIWVPCTLGQDGSTGARTASDPLIPLDELTLLLQPLTKSELVVEADAWLAVLQAKVQEISEAEISVKRKSAEIARAEEAADAAAEAAAKEGGAGDAAPAAGEPAPPQEATAEEVQAKVEEKVETIDSIVALHEERSKIIDRTNLVLAALKEKGGETEEYDLYVRTVSGITIDVSDTGAAWRAITGWLKSEEGGLRWAKNIIWFIVTIIVFWVVGRIASKAIEKTLTLTKNVSDLLRDFLTKSTRRGIMLIGVIVALAQLEVNIGPLVAAIGAAGFVIAFALQGTLSNFASGLLILIYRPYDVGHVIDVAGVSGSVKSMSLLSTTITTFDNKTVVVPNNSIWGNTITNVTGNETRRVDMVFGIGYADDADKAQELIADVLAEHPLVLKDPAPVVRVHELADSSVNLICRPWANTADYWTVYWDVLKTVKERFDAQGISIPFPQRDVHVHQVPAAGA